MADESLVVFPAPLVRTFFERPQFVSERSRTQRLLTALCAGSVVPRGIAEKESSMTQAVAYATLRSGNDLVCLRRRSQAREELNDRWTVVFGGHVNGDERDGLAGLRRCLKRELREEFGEIDLRSPNFIGVVADPRSEVGRQHLGFMFEVEILAKSMRLDRSFDNHDYSLIPGRRHFSEIHRLLEEDPGRFDPWSQLVLNAYPRPLS
jgi:predicted NUDIX family phosphoesterase